MTNDHSQKKLAREIASFIEERDWQQFHSPKNLAMALSVEASELLEIFQWLTEKQSFNPDRKTTEKIEEEIGDVMIYLMTLSEKFRINPIEAALKKMDANRKKYPPQLSRGNAVKYTHFNKNQS